MLGMSRFTLTALILGGICLAVLAVFVLNFNWQDSEEVGALLAVIVLAVTVIAFAPKGKGLG